MINPDWTIFEFLKQENEIFHERAFIPDKVFGLISDMCNLPDICRYSHKDFKKLFDFTVNERYSMKRLENLRTGENVFFTAENMGWIEVCLLAK